MILAAYEFASNLFVTLYFIISQPLDYCQAFFISMSSFRRVISVNFTQHSADLINFHYSANFKIHSATLKISS